MSSLNALVNSGLKSYILIQYVSNHTSIWAVYRPVLTLKLNLKECSLGLVHADELELSC